MIRKLIAAAAVAGLFAATPSLAANSCRNAQGKFIKCPTAPAKKASAKSSVAKGKDGKCRFTTGPNKGKFTKCP